MLLDRRNWPPHRPWALFALLAFAAATAWFFGASAGAAAWPSGGSLSGMTFGTAGGLIVLFELLLWLRKQFRTWRVGTAQAWLRAHIWLGLLCLPLLIYHSGFRLGGLLSTVLLALLVVVVLSGVLGLALQQFLPARMLNEVPAETIYSQIDRVAAQFGREAERLVQATCGPAAGQQASRFEEGEAPGGGSFVVVGAVRAAGRVQGKFLQTQVPRAPVAEAEPLRLFFQDAVAPYLEHGAKSGSVLLHPNRAAVLFGELRTRIPPTAHGVADALENLCEQRRQLDGQRRLHFWLHSWLWVHLPLSVALGVLMIVHIVVALKYW